MNLIPANGFYNQAMESLPNCRIACNEEARSLHQYVYSNDEHLFLVLGKNPAQVDVERAFGFYDWVLKHYRQKIKPTVVVSNVPQYRKERNIILDIDGEIQQAFITENDTLLVLFQIQNGVIYSTSDFGTKNFKKNRIKALRKLAQ
ncbi:hypothetical protein [Winogradskyella forsetii]|uniref:hypothetical protein n=1 Tax=Winogradskyella forsetii TaxID=2686077 RepID=UPI0015C9611E|nr:hypothetical protein [Winogradskyella forsetii]